MKLFSEAVYKRAVAHAWADTTRWQHQCFAKPGVGIWQAVGRMMGARKRYLKQPEHRQFPTFTPGMTTAAYVRDYYTRNGLNADVPERRDYDYKRNCFVVTHSPFRYPESYITMIERPAPIEQRDDPANDSQPMKEAA